MPDMDSRTTKYVENLQTIIRQETVSKMHQEDKSKFLQFHDVLKNIFPNIFSTSEYENFNGSLLLKWKGKNSSLDPVIFMNHHDVVEATGKWEHEPFSGDVADGKLWGRGTLDTKGGLWAMLQAADELAGEGFVPERDIYFESSCTEEVDGSGCRAIVSALKERGIHFYMCLDEGGMMVYDPIGGADGTFAMVGVAEKSQWDLKFTAKGNGGHASAPGSDTPLVRLGKFMAAFEKKNIFQVKMQPVVMETFKRFASSMKGPLKLLMGHPKFFKPVIEAVAPGLSPVIKAMFQTTVAFTMAEGSGGTNVIPEEAWILGDMRCSHHQGPEKSIEAIKNLAQKYDIEVAVTFAGADTKVSNFDCPEFSLLEKNISRIFPKVVTVPYIMNVCSDSRFMESICDCCYRFTPFTIDQAQLDSIHGLNENVDISTLVPAVNFYESLIKDI